MSIQSSLLLIFHSGSFFHSGTRYYSFFIIKRTRSQNTMEDNSMFVITNHLSVLIYFKKNGVMYSETLYGKTLPHAIEYINNLLNSHGILKIRLKAKVWYLHQTPRAYFTNALYEDAIDTWFNNAYPVVFFSPSESVGSGKSFRIPTDAVARTELDKQRKFTKIGVALQDVLPKESIRMVFSFY